MYYIKEINDRLDNIEKDLVMLNASVNVPHDTPRKAAMKSIETNVEVLRMLIQFVKDMEDME